MGRFAMYGKTDQGRRRRKNEDTIVVDEDRGFCLVADGIGGTAAGDIASQLFARAAETAFSGASYQEEIRYQLLQAVFLNANEAIFSYAGSHPGCEGMGCTAEMLVLTDTRFILGHIGDSRTYRFRDGQFKLLTTDHTLVKQQLDQGLITREEADHHSFKNVILRAVGIQKDPALDILRGHVYPGDMFVLCSDGLTDMMDDDMIKSHLFSEKGIREKVDGLIQEANDRGGKDNISVVLVQIL
ncbi:MAG TPA: Stp1/IreP family PP2C-type Ser/Thr phosphatase [Desulfotignum sp.]|nr:Stp1/IreP family PP2C-type Ser/Thr phosphatase [Desulfotignum sp.]